MKRFSFIILLLLAGGAGIFWWLTAPNRLATAALPAHTADLTNGETFFFAGGCGSCHAAKSAKGDDKLLLGGGQSLDTPFGIFKVPNISPDETTGIGGWSDLDFVNAMMRGVSPGGSHYYPAFPYTSYARMKVEDVLDVKAFIDTLQPVENIVGDHELTFPFTIRRGIGLWKHLYLNEKPIIDLAGADENVLLGQYLVEGAGHCGECHTKRDFFGGLETGHWLAGGPNPDGPGTIPNITPSSSGIGSWSASDIAYYLDSGFTPDFDTAGGSMVSVQENMAKLPNDYRQAIADYLKAIPPHGD